jgi:simple sugar transport system ATP-binding protein
VGSLSVAQKQMVAISRALMSNARLIIMDEPTTALTKKEVRALFKIILQLKAEGISILFVSHKLNEVFEISERFTILRNGELVKSGSTADLDNAKFIYYMTGREFKKKNFVPESIGEKPLLEVKNLTLDGFFESISFELRAGEIIGITGLLDSGRSELALSLFGIRPATSGDILVKGKKVDIKSPQDAIKNRIGLVPEDRLSEGLFLPQSIHDNLIISEIDKLTTSLGFFDINKREEEVDRLVHEFAIATPDAENACQTLSGGNQQRVVLAKWLACNLDVLVLSGPTVGVDIGSKHDIHAILQDLAKTGMGIIIISDDLPEVTENCSRVIVLKGGKITRKMDAQDANEQQILAHMM